MVSKVALKYNVIWPSETVAVVGWSDLRITLDGNKTPTPDATRVIVEDPDYHLYKCPHETGPQRTPRAYD